MNRKQILTTLAIILVTGVIAFVYKLFNSENKLYSPSSIHLIEADYSQSKVLKGELVLVDSSNCTTVSVVGDYLLLVKNNPNSLISVYDLKKMMLVGSFGRIGNARNELIGVPYELYCLKKIMESLMYT